MLENFSEGKVYEVLLVTAANITPVGVVRRGDGLRFKLFPGRSFQDILSDSRVSIQLTNDVELLVRYALNLEVDSEIERKNGWRWIKGLPGFYGRVNWRIQTWKDEIGETEVLSAEFLPEGVIPGELPVIPFSRADCILVEMAVLFTRHRIRPTEESEKKLLNLHSTYRRLGGDSPVAEYMVSFLTDEGQNGMQGGGL